jgi:hypothetical protein
LLKIETMDNSEWNERIEERKARFEEKARRIEERWERRARHRGYDHRGGRAWTGLFLLIIGGLLLARQAGVYFPEWVFTWPMFLVGLGLLIGVRHRFRGFGWAIPLMIGGIYLAEMISAHTSLRPVHMARSAHYPRPVLRIPARAAVPGIKTNTRFPTQTTLFRRKAKPSRTTVPTDWM